MNSRGLVLDRQVLYVLSHTPSPFCLVIFLVSSHVYSQAGLSLGLPISCSPLLLGEQAHTTTHSFFPLRVSLFARAGLKERRPLHLCLLSS
jgi:hypothetical protein